MRRTEETAGQMVSDSAGDRSEMVEVDACNAARKKRRERERGRE